MCVCDHNSVVVTGEEGLGAELAGAVQLLLRRDVPRPSGSSACASQGCSFVGQSLRFREHKIRRAAFSVDTSAGGISVNQGLRELLEGARAPWLGKTRASRWPQVRRFKHTPVCLTLVEFGRPRSRYQRSRFLAGPVSWFADGHALGVSSWERGQALWALRSKT